ncbi:hypothetical protein [Chryseobacterium luteum]|jgi:hypothetical protein|uniref:Uncharacterized protein n=1 Tax=Chryseobacterium luteum TaxID=421531 RepID=A0A085ZB90_9FLAO|nr:hypothetical protein [Chryseobacterium luteum]KFF01704.1 hypothetical protein IX38_16685 [Chryseobacterium luteum]
MKKTAALLLGLTGIFSSAQTSSFVFNNYNVYDAVGRLMTCSPNPGPIRYMYASPNGSFGSYTMPAGISSSYASFGTTGLASFPMNMNQWNVTDPANTANNASFVYNDPYIVSTMSSINEWASFHFFLQDSAGNTVDSYLVGDPSIAINAGVTANAYQVGVNSGIEAEWFTITTSTGKITFFSIYP